MASSDVSAVPPFRPTIAIGKPKLTSLFEVATYSTDFSWRSLLLTAKPEIDHIEKMLVKAQSEEMGSVMAPETWLYYPPRQQVFRSLQYTPLDQVKVIILGMDPYPGRNADGTSEACGIAFSCEQSVPASLKNIFLEIKRDYPDFVLPTVGDLRKWCQQGVLLMNASFTFLPIGDQTAQRRQQQLWLQLVHRIMGDVTTQQKNLAICLWGRDAQRYNDYVSGSHLILTASHPSPRSFASTDEPFKGCSHFKKINDHLEKHGKAPIDWSLV